MTSAPSGLTFLDCLNRIHYLKNDTDIEEILAIIQHLRNYKSKFPVFQNEIFFIIDYCRKKHILMTGNVEEIIGYHPQDFLENGLAMIIDIFQKDDFKIYNEHIYSSIFDLFKQRSPKEHSNFIFEFNYRMLNKAKKNVSIWQRSCYVTDASTSLPLFSYGTCMDITKFRQDNSIIKKISKYNPGSASQRISEISTDYYYPDPQLSILSKREMELLKWIAEGLSTKQIAAKFRLSSNTVMNHRKNMLRKTNTKNVAELIYYAISQRIL